MIKRIRPNVQSVRMLGAVALLAQVFVIGACGEQRSRHEPHRRRRYDRSSGNDRGRAGPPARPEPPGPAGAGGSMAFGEPACLSSVVKGGACTPTDQQFCYKTCGPVKSGVKTETCQTSGTYAEMSGCTFNPANNYACYKIPAAAQTACPAGVTPQGSMDCGTCRSARRATASRAPRAVSISTRAARPRSAGASARRPTATGCARGAAPATRRGRARSAPAARSAPTRRHRKHTLTSRQTPRMKRERSSVATSLPRIVSAGWLFVLLGCNLRRQTHRRIQLRVR